MNKNIFTQLLSALVVLILLLLAANPFKFWMPTPIVMILVCGLAVAFFAFSSLVFKERTLDEREQYHALLAGRTSFLVGSTILLIAIVIKELQGNPDPWLMSALAGMIITKLVVRIIAEIKK